MQKKHLLLILLMAFIAPLAMNGQTTANVVSGGTSTNQYIPMYNWYNDYGFRSEYIIPASYFTSAGLTNGDKLKSITLYRSATGSWSSSTMTIQLTNTTTSYYSNTSFLGKNGTTVYTTSSYNGGTSSSYTFNFSSDFEYTGGSLVVHIYATSGGTATSSSTGSTWLGYSNTTNNQALYSSGSSAANATTGTAQKFIPNTTFTYERATSDPYISLSHTSATVLTGFTTTLTATTHNVTGTPTITYSSNNTSVATVSGSGTTATVTGVAPGTATITATMTYNSNTYTAQCAITVEDPSYCEPIPSSRDGNGITAVAFGTDDVVNNSSSSGLPSSAPYYGDYTSMVGSFEAGEVATVSITYTTGTSTYYNYGTLIWVDWNKDYIFDDSEIVFQGQSSQQSNPSGPHTLDATFTVPASQAADDYRMRIAGADSYFDRYLSGYSDGAHDACFSSTYAVCHDYTLRVVALGAYTITCATTTGGTITADKTNADENDVVTITATPDADYLLTALTYTPEGGSAQNIDITNTPYTFTMPAANVTVNATFSQPTCPKPTNLTVSNLAASHANVSWDSEAGNYTVKYSTATVDGTTLDPVFEDGFENGLGSWTTYANGFSGEGTTNWQTFDGSQFDDQTNHGGSYSAMSRSWTSSTGDVDVDNWLVSPQMTLGNTLKFWVTTNSGYPGSYAVYVSTGSGVVPSSGTGDFEVVANLTLATGSWVEQTYDLSAYAGQQGYVAIRHKDNAQDYFLVDDFGVFNTINSYSYGGWTTVNPNPTTNSCPITGLSAETLYAVQVQANCGGTDGSSAWSSVMFTTPDNCGAPQELASSDITATTATLSWADDKDSYNLQYRKVYFHEGFESETMPTGWTTIDNNNDGLCWHIGSSTAHSGVNGVCNSSFVYSSDFSVNTTPDDYLISPQLDLQGTLRVWLSGYPRGSSDYSEHFEILLSTTGTSVSDFTTTLVAESTTTNSYVEYTADLSSYTGKGYIAIHHFNCTNQNYLYVDDFGIYGSENWVTLSPNPTTETANLTGLTPTIENGIHLLPTTYEWQVQGVNCDGNGNATDWSAPATFTTLEGYFKEITGYGTGNGNWYLIATPLAGQNGETDPTSVTNLINENGYDLYYFDQTKDLEWINYKETPANGGGFSLVNGQGYLYANKEDVQLVFTGSAYTGINTFDLTYSEDNSDAIQHGWNLVGNPFATSASVNQSFCTLNNTSDGISTTAVNAGGTIGAMEGVFVKATGTGQSVTFTQGGAKKSRSINIDVTRNGEFLDRAIVSLSTDGSLCKLSLSDNTTKVYFRQDQKDYAIITSENENEMPVSFKASRNGNYTITVNAEEVEFNYLHLIDNLTGNDVDLLANPNYSFDAKTTDYASRFKLVFVCGDANGDNDTFAFFSNGGFVINNDGQATLQVIDVNGRILKSESINGCANVNFNAAPAVYMLRLINGDNVKIQKVVVK